MHKKRKLNISFKYDIHIIEALKNLPVPLTTFDDHEVYFVNNKRNETIFEHISNQKHGFKVSDINEIPLILKDTNSLKFDVKKKIFRNYVGKRPKKNAKLKYIKIITRKMKGNKEIIETIYLIKNKSIERKRRNW